MPNAPSSTVASPAHHQFEAARGGTRQLPTTPMDVGSARPVRRWHGIFAIVHAAAGHQGCFCRGCVLASRCIRAMGVPDAAFGQARKPIPCVSTHDACCWRWVRHHNIPRGHTVELHGPRRIVTHFLCGKISTTWNMVNTALAHHAGPLRLAPLKSRHQCSTSPTP